MAQTESEFLLALLELLGWEGGTYDSILHEIGAWRLTLQVCVHAECEGLPPNWPCFWSASQPGAALLCEAARENLRPKET